MGGFGAYSIASDHPGRFCAVGAHEPAIWNSGGESAFGAFDDADDFTRHDVIEHARRDPSPFVGTKLWIDHASNGAFPEGTRSLVAALNETDADLTVRQWPGDHTMKYVRSHLRPILRFYAYSLIGCGR